MKFTIGTVSSNIDMTEDINLIKSALLYADEIELIGMVEYAIFKYLPGLVNNAKGLEELMTNWIPFLQSVEVPDRDNMIQQIQFAQEQLKTIEPIIKKKKYRNKQEILAQMQFNKAEKQVRDMLMQGIEEVLDQSGSGAIQPLIDQKVVSVFDYAYKDFEQNKLVGGYFGNLLRTMREGTSYPLFDKASTDVISSVSTTKLLDIGHINAEVLRHAGVASNILMTLPTLEAASFDQLLDLKKDHTKELQQFRTAMYVFSEKMTLLPWDEDFEYECLKLYHTEVVPHIEEINEVMTETSVLKNIGAKAVKDEEVRKGAGYAVAGLTSVITTSSNMMAAFGTLKDALLGLALISISPAMAKAFMKTISIVGEARKETKEAKKEAVKNVMYYYYLASKL